MKELSAIVLHYKNLDLTHECIDYLVRSFEHESIDGEIIVVDNSSDFRYYGTFKSLTHVNPRRNLGFSKANNLGILHSSGKYILIINNDAFATSSSLKYSIDLLKNRKNVAIWAPVLIYPDGREQSTSSKLPNLIDLLDEYILFNLFRKLKKFFVGSVKFSQPVAVESIIGAFWMMRREVIFKTGPLNESFFFTSEDTEYCHRLKRLGWEIILDRRERVIHLGSASQNHTSWAKDNHLHEGRKIYFREVKGRYQALIASMIIFFGIKIRGAGR